MICCFLFFAFALVPETKSGKKNRRHSQSRPRTRRIRHRAPGFDGILDSSQNAATECRVILANNPEDMPLQVETIAAGDLLQKALLDLDEQRRAATMERQKRLLQEQQLQAESQLRIDAENAVSFLTSQLSITKENGRVTESNLIERMDWLQKEIQVLKRARETEPNEEDAQLEQLIQTLHSSAEKLLNENNTLLQQISVLRQENISLKNTNSHLVKEYQEQSRLQKQQQVIAYKRDEAADEKDNHEKEESYLSISPQYIFFGTEETL